jgi:hypothetical protein
MSIQLRVARHCNLPTGVVAQYGMLATFPTDGKSAPLKGAKDFSPLIAHRI